MDVGLVKVIDLCSRLADVVLLLLSVHIDYAVAKEPICALLTAQYEALNVVVKLVGLILSTDNSNRIVLKFFSIRKRVLCVLVKIVFFFIRSHAVCS